ncbi:conserved hypothetical protein [Candida dubliniensis CD36]|uniref:Uncharacterized protein n=1 Tax=Candida dubliniensis (strain CD36 / ATCC MYA-646 / CBS 7987 / NCPF 3949 / NRRL Y-17841) TaxID=573826 RepID=B9WA34_CANDC|nr:conserved hypothetical protein [Candida dubliniensis CD36]CAX45672.1 conserved hypothetical protein [Candida dubliniensis CD36]
MLYKNIQQQQSITPPQTNQFKNQQTDEYEERGRAKGKDTVCQSTNTQLPSTQDQTVLKYQSQGPMRSRSTNDTSVLANRRKAINKRTGSEQLLLTAINQNHQSKSKLTRSISSQGVNTLQQQQQQQHLHHYHRTPQLPLQSKKNIPMVNNELPPPNQARPQFRRWNSYNVPKTISKDPAMESDSKLEIIIDKNSISPLTVLKDQYDTKRPITNNVITNTSTDNSFSSLSKNNANEVKPDRKSQITLASSHNQNLYEKMKSMAHTGMSSLLFLTGNETQEKSVKSYLQSDSDDESDEDEEELWGRKLNENTLDSDTQYAIEQINDTTTSDEPDNQTIDFEDLMTKISGFQENLVHKLPYTNVKLSRTQQRQLDYKQLYEYESTDKENSSDLVCYDWKIQNETILSQYTSIRLRFSSKQTTNTRQNKQNVENHMGILGFIDRFKNSTTSNTSTSNLETSFDDVNAKLNKVWTQEFSHLFVHIPQQDTNTVPEVEDKNIYEGKTANMNKLAKGVKLNGLLKI